MIHVWLPLGIAVAGSLCVEHLRGRPVIELLLPVCVFGLFIWLEDRVDRSK